MQKILIADDSQFYRKVIGDLLKDAGYDVSIATDGRKALDMVKKQRPDLVISDVLMPNMDGYVLTLEIQRDQGLQSMPIILCSGTHSAQKYHDLALNLGAVTFLPKDASSQEWLTAVRQAIAGGPPPPPKGGKKVEAEKAVETTSDTEMKLYNKTLIEELEDRCLALERENTRLNKMLKGLTSGMERLIAESRR